MATPAVFGVANSTSPDLLGGLCAWTSSLSLCLGTAIPIFLIVSLLSVLLVRGLMVTPQRSALEELMPPSQSPLIPDEMKAMDSKALQNMLSTVDDIPLKVFLPRLGLDELVGACAMLGVASVRDILRINRLALRDIGMGPKEQRLFSAGLERRIRLRSRMRQMLAETIDGAQREKRGKKTQNAAASL